ncbi:hypothetical protein C922_00385 [Plasmodium inui San Antonio 1]|uniref:B box-type domain-containing protein n=1 Tax=Plasmodium inui San Antonio 1 TaxID=1237626 RepID=W7A8K1_9APIC|nr:hypothetical protein C922_00385 [Plasmodium inui San Antonio 1]EUD69522.1 hypothetical protein C922_00385 [Plasmodium inui San Antonio 1]
MEGTKQERGQGEGSQDEEGDDFRSVYKRVVVKNKSLNEKTNSNKAFSEMLEISRITDYNMVMKYEYLLKLSFFSSNVNVLNVYRLVKPESEKQFDEIAARLRSNILLSIMDTNKINDKSEHVGEYFTKNYEQLKHLEFVIGNTDYPLGFEKNTNGVFRVYLFKVIPSKTLLLNKNNLSYMEKDEMPSNYDSVAVDKDLFYEQLGSSERRQGGEGENDLTGGGQNKGTSISMTRGRSNYSYIYKVRSAEQVLPLLLIEFEFKCLRVDISVPICEYCYTAKAIYYCHNDKVHLCNICDIKHHEKNKILKNHRRMPISESPYQFGKCAYHPNEVVESVCMKCYCSLCPNCLLIGSHSKGNYRNHPIVNIKDAFILSNRKQSLSDVNLENRKVRILDLLKRKHKLLAEIYSNYSSLQKRIDTLYRYIIDELKVLKKKKMQYIMALKRAVLSQLLTIEWTDAFFYHTKLSLNLSDFILYQKKHELTVQFLMAKKGKDSDFMKSAPHWLFQKIYVQSSLSIYEDSFFKLNFVSPKDLDEGMTKRDIDRKRCVLKGSRNKLEEMYNFNNAFNDKKGYLGLYDETAFEGGTKAEESAHPASVKYSVAQDAEVKQSPQETAHDSFSNPIEPANTTKLSNKDVQSVLKIKKEYASMYDVTEEKPTNCNLLIEIFRDTGEVNLCGRGTIPLKQSHICRELWKHLVNYKYINVIHILKARCSLNTLLLTHSFFNVASYYDSLEDLVKHIIKHEIYTLLNKNIDYHTKMKVTHVLDSVATLLCLRRFVLAPWVDKYIQLCCSQVGNEERGVSSPSGEASPKGDIIYEKNSEVKDEHTSSVHSANEKVKGTNLIRKSDPGEVTKGDKHSYGEFRIRMEEEEFPTDGGNNTVLGDRTVLDDQTVLEEDNAILEDMNTKKDGHHMRSRNGHDVMADVCLTVDEKQELSTLKKIKEHIYVYLEMLINDLVKIPHKNLNDGVRFMFYLIHDEIDGKNKNLAMNEKKFSIHTLCLCLDIFLNSVLYPYIFYVHEENLKDQVKTPTWKDSSLHQKVAVMFGQTVREISIYVFQIYNLGMYDSNLKAFINNIKDNKMLRGRTTNEKMFFLDVSQKLFQWIIKNLESPRYYAPVRWTYREGVEKSYQRIVQEIVHIDESSTNNCVKENVDYNVLFSTENFREILSLCYSMQGVGA